MTLSDIARMMQNFHVNIDVAQPFDIQNACSYVIVYCDKNTENKDFNDSLRLAREMAILCVSAVKDNIIKARFESCFSVIKTLASGEF